MAVGRPRAFDEDKAVDQALLVFLRKGYDGASLADLTGAMGIKPPSLYAAFGNKEGLFRRALDRYAEHAEPLTEAAMAAPTARQSTELLMRGTIDSQTRNEVQGCLVVHGALACSDASAPIKRELIHRRQLSEAFLQRRYDRGVADGDLPPDTDTATLARFVATMLQGTAVQAASGVPRDDLYKLVDMTLRAFPPERPRRRKKD